MRNFKFLGVSFLLAITAATSGTAQNPIIQTKYTADPAPMVYNDTVFLYTTHDEDDAEGFKMLDWLLYTSTDMVNWTDHGEILNSSQVSWGRKEGGFMWIMVPGQNRSSNVMASFTCIARFTVMVLAYWYPTLLTVLLKTL